ncbi:hypothetical protein P692DRAFT_20842876 [Suillus brevipes Sb2]|nr:hypothetical protein P692DRAFT_20842876 [Suillus brevipes Sb2]
MLSHGTDRAFTNFWMKLNGFLNNFLPQHNIPLPDGRRIHLRAEDTITVFHFLRVNYESIVDWRLHRDLLWCHPKFYGLPRYDCVIMKTADKPFFARLMRDNDMGLWHVRAKPRISSEIISVQSIIRGAALANDPETDGDYFVIHTVDTDMFL